MKKKYHSEFICPICGNEYNSCIYCQQIKQDICQNHCQNCEHFRKISGCWHCVSRFLVSADMHGGAIKAGNN
nr:MAG TPA: 50S ribosomal subunit [Caudoviricetes sp.]DAP96873.1 MAG TPA: 50S ribosomal subunit [Caudoviricetes sp.]